MQKSSGNSFPTRGIQTGHVHVNTVTGLLFRYLGGDPTNDLNWIVIGGSVSSDPDTTGWGTAQAGATWYNTTLDAIRTFDGSSVSSL